jgi:hypothetical protein
MVVGLFSGCFFFPFLFDLQGRYYIISKTVATVKKGKIPYWFD